MIIEFETEEQFARLLTALTNDLVNANVSWRLYVDLTKSWDGEYSREFYQSPVLWSLTIGALADATIFRLIRIYDGHIASLSLRNLLDTISANLHLFDTDKFRERLKDHPFVERLAEGARAPDKKQLAKDIDFASNRNLPVRKLTILRNSLLTHKRAAHVVEGYDAAEEFPLSDTEVSELASTGVDILNRYSSLFRASTYSTEMVGADDFKFVLKTVRRYLEQRDKKLEEERKMYEILEQEL